MPPDERHSALEADDKARSDCSWRLSRCFKDKDSLPRSIHVISKPPSFGYEGLCFGVYLVTIVVPLAALRKQQPTSPNYSTTRTAIVPHDSCKSSTMRC